MFSLGQGAFKYYMSMFGGWGLTINAFIAYVVRGVVLRQNAYVKHMNSYPTSNGFVKYQLLGIWS